MLCHCDRLSTGMSEEEFSILRASLSVNPDHLTEQVSSSSSRSSVSIVTGDDHMMTYTMKGMGGNDNISGDAHVNHMSH